jgi:hypothetical protein
MSSASKGRWLGFATVAVVTIAWAIVAHESEGQADFGSSAIVLAAGIYIGVPYGLLAGTSVGRLAGRLRRFRALVVVASAAWALFPNLPWLALVADRNDHVPYQLASLSLAPALLAGLLLERATRPHELVPRAAVLRA